MLSKCHNSQSTVPASPLSWGRAWRVHIQQPRLPALPQLGVPDVQGGLEAAQACLAWGRRLLQTSHVGPGEKKKVPELRPTYQILVAAVGGVWKFWGLWELHLPLYRAGTEERPVDTPSAHPYWPRAHVTLRWAVGEPVPPAPPGPQPLAAPLPAPQEEDALVRWASVLGNMADQLYYPCEHLAWAADAKVLHVDSARWWAVSTALWGVSLLLGIAR